MADLREYRIFEGIESRKRAEWVKVGQDEWHCSGCGNYEFADEPADEAGYLYCSKCGAYIGRADHESD